MLRQASGIPGTTRQKSTEVCRENSHPPGGRSWQVTCLEKSTNDPKLFWWEASWDVFQKGLNVKQDELGKGLDWVPVSTWSLDTMISEKALPWPRSQLSQKYHEKAGSVSLRILPILRQAVQVHAHSQTKLKLLWILFHSLIYYTNTYCSPQWKVDDWVSDHLVPNKYFPPEAFWF